MIYTRLGKSGLKVSRICLGCMSYGVPDRGPHQWSLPEEQSRPFFKQAFDLGVNFFDTANVYSDGTSEEITGKLLKEFARREDYVLATKVHGRMSPGPNGAGLSRKAIMQEIDASLSRLKTDYVDLYQTHRWDYDTPIEETLEALHDVVKAGKARYIGASSMWSWQFAKALYLADRHGWTRFISMQNHYNLLYREEERGMVGACLDQGIGMIPWSPLARGKLTRPWSDEKTTERSKTDQYTPTLYGKTEQADKAVVDRLNELAAQQGKPPAQRNIISFNGSFHGRTMATVTLTAQPKYHVGFEPMPGGFVYCDRFNDEAAIEALVDENTCAIFVEPVQGEGGVMPAKPGFLKHLRALCDKVGALLVIDEIQAGLGRTGTLFAFAQDGIKPDVVTLAKALGGGLPIGAMLVGDKAQDVLQFGTHGTTFGGNPVMAAVALASVTKLSSDAVRENVADKAKKLREGLEAIHAELGLFADIRGRGLMMGAELIAAHAGKSGDISEAARQAGVLVLVAGPNVMRFLPPLTITDDELRQGLQRFKQALLTYTHA